MKKEIIELLIKYGAFNQEIGERIIRSDIPKVIAGRIDTYTDAQLIIYLAIHELDKVGADVELTNAGLDLQNALNRLTKYLIKEQNSTLIAQS